MPSKCDSDPSIALCDLGRGWRGGQRQILALAEVLNGKGLKVNLICRRGSMLFQRATMPGLQALQISFSPLLIPVLAFRLARKLRGLGVNLLHASDSHSHGLAIALKKFMPHLKVVVTARTCFPGGGRLSHSIKYASSAVDKFVAISQAVADNLKGRGVVESRLEIIPSAIDRKVFNSQGRAENEIFTIGTACALEKGKGVETILRALSRCKDRLGAFSFLVAGEGEEKAALKHLASHLQLADRVEFLGFVDDMPAFYRRCDAYLLASYSEGLGSSLLEAAACGAVPVGTGSGGIPEIIEDGISGFLFAPGDERQLGEILVKLAASVDLRMRIGRAVDERLKDYDINIMADKYLALYRILQCKGGR